MKSQNLYVKSAKVQKCKSAKPAEKNMEKNGHGSCSIRKKCVPL